MKPSAAAEMPFTRESVLQMLIWGANPEASSYSHKQIAEWCYRFCCQYLDVDAEPEIESLLPVLTDVETQWELYLANTYTLEELRAKDLNAEQMPEEWFNDRLQQLATSARLSMSANAHNRVSTFYGYEQCNGVDGMAFQTIPIMRRCRSRYES